LSVDRHIERRVRLLLLARAHAVLDVHEFEIEHDDPHEVYAALAERLVSKYRQHERRRELLRALSHADDVDDVSTLTKSQRRTLRRKLGLVGKVPVGRPPQTEHGTPGMWRKGCKCDACREWCRQRAKLDRQRRRERERDRLRAESASSNAQAGT
jgi:hypothetical protein